MVEPISTVLGTALLVKTLENAIDGIFSKGAQLHNKLAGKTLKRYKQQFLASISRISDIKNLLYRQKPVYLPDIYVPPHLTHNEIDITDVDLFERFFDNQRIIVTAPAGYGKSVLLKYLAIHHVDHWRSKIPIFIELRKIDYQSFSDLPSIVEFFYGGPKKNKNSDDLTELLVDGYLTIILDGFDEIPDEFKGKMQGIIEAFAYDFPTVPIIISGRVDPNFSSWEQFYVYEIEAMSLDATLKLIDKLDYDEELKAEFVKKAIPSLFEDKDKSFVQTPLLAVLMLLTYELYKDIPRKMHLFYAQAFNALLRGHDVTKSMAQLQLKCGLPDDKFKKAFSAFCAATYFRSKYELNQQELEDFSRNALLFVGSEIDPSTFYTDLLQNVCVLQYEGLQYSFVHRSFQEYFTAVYLASAPTESVSRYLTKQKSRYGESVLSMLIEIDADRIEVEWVQPNLDKILNKYDKLEKESASKRFFLDFSKNYWFHMRGGEMVGLGTPNSILYGNYRTIYSMYGGAADSFAHWFIDWDIIRAALKPIIEWAQTDEGKASNILDVKRNYPPEKHDESLDAMANSEIDISVKAEHYEIWKSAGFVAITDRHLNWLRSIRNGVLKRNDQRKTFEDFGLR